MQVVNNFQSYTGRKFDGNSEFETNNDKFRFNDEFELHGLIFKTLI